MKETIGKRIGFAVTGSFCTFSAAFAEAERLVAAGYSLTPIFSEHAASIDTRFGKAVEQRKKLEQICGKPALLTISDVEPLGPKDRLDALLVAPCTANTMAKLAMGITDTTVTMAVKSMLRNEKPIILALATNDALQASAKNLGLLLISYRCGRMLPSRNHRLWWLILPRFPTPLQRLWVDCKFNQCLYKIYKI